MKRFNYEILDVKSILSVWTLEGSSFHITIMLSIGRGLASKLFVMSQIKRKGGHL